MKDSKKEDKIVGFLVNGAEYCINCLNYFRFKHAMLKRDLAPISRDMAEGARKTENLDPTCQDCGQKLEELE